MIKDLVEPLRLAMTNEAAALEKLLVAEIAWAGAVAPLELGPWITIGELRQACSLRGLLVDALARREVATEAQAGLALRHRSWAERIAVCLGVGGASLATLLAAADQRVATAFAEFCAADDVGRQRNASLSTGRVDCLWHDGRGRSYAIAPANCEIAPTGG